MLLSVKWLREFVPFEGTAEELGDRLTMLGLELEDLVHPFESIRDIVIGRVLTCEPHPDSDHMSVCTVDVNQGESVQIVCGAPNVAQGQTVPVALPGTVMPGGMAIKKAKLRGVPSYGMICSERELGLSDDHNGIMVLPDTFNPGIRLIEALDLDEEVLDIGITPNRADCLSVLGLAREAALSCHLPLTLPQAGLRESGEDWHWDIEIPEGEYCPSYRLRRVAGVKIAPSPLQMRCRLHAVGVRPISNIVDVTNYILMELGQPLHAFDQAFLRNGSMKISRAAEGERIVTLDGQERVLKDSDLLIRDGDTPVALAGIMGGLNSEIREDSRNVIIESAVFKPGTIRMTARRLGISSESSYRFERGVDQPGSVYALDRAAAMMAELGGGVVCRGTMTCEPSPWKSPEVPFRVSRAEDILGMKLGDDFCRDTLHFLGCGINDADPECWRVTVPGWRGDVTREIDLVEEAARVKGMDTIPENLPAVSRSIDDFGKIMPMHDFITMMKYRLASIGLHEVENYSFVGDRDLDILDLPKEERIHILNPLSEDQGVLRTELAPGLLQNVRQNTAHGNAGVQLFEIAKRFVKNAESETSAEEHVRLGIVLYGEMCAQAWPNTVREADYSDLRGVVEYVASCVHAGGSVRFIRSAASFLEPRIEVLAGDKSIGFLGRVKPDIAAQYNARHPVWLAEFDMEALRNLYFGFRPGFAPLPVFPPSRRDITVTAPFSLSVKTVLETVQAMKMPLLESICLLDLYEPEHSEERNLTFRLTFRDAERTLRDSEVDREREKIASALVKQLSVRL
ncbi:MAG: phenylalanine--tRNA ligase subunit beta [Desulfovibrionaceae bacterium]|nr:phenylalanine--tRNA ligase subunit beta [Desulfovibrionaceae bacterium]